ncbi:MAG: retropepsin-like aspartic protease, partial [Cyclobacteriaceae bacterium]
MKFRLLLFLCLACYGASGQLRIGFWLESNIVRIPFQIVNNSIFVKVDLNEHRELSFIVDTGSSFSVVFSDPTLTLPLQFKMFNIRGFGKMDSLSANVSVYNTLSLGPLTSYGQQILVVEKDKVGFQQFFDRPLHGIIGLDVLRNFNVEFNFVTQKMILRNNEVRQRKGRRWTKIPFQVYNNTLMVPAVISDSQSKKDSVSLIIDTGSELPLLLAEEFCPPGAAKTIIGLGFLGYASGRIGEIKKVHIGDITLENLTTAFPDSTSSKWNAVVPHQGNIGIQLLKKYRLAINYNEGLLYLKPIRRLFEEPLSYNRSGLAVDVHGEAVCPYYISEIA